MGFLRRRSSRDRDDPVDVPVDVPAGMAAVSTDEMAGWAQQLADEASELAVSREVPQAIDLSAKTALPAVHGEASALHAATPLLAYNLFLLGYWCREVELRVLGHGEADAAVTRELEKAHARGPGGKEWLGTLQAAAYGLAGWDEEDPEIIAAVRERLPANTGEHFHEVYAVTGTVAVRDAIDAQHPGASEPLSGSEMRMCWEVGYWMRAVSICLPDAAHAEFEAHGDPSP
jgi:hypothetical protein